MTDHLQLVPPPPPTAGTRYPLAFDTWGDAELDAIHGVVESGRFSMGERVAQFEREFAEFTGARHCVMVSSGSTANLLMAAALRYRSAGAIAPGAEIVVPAVGWATTYFPFSQHGYKLRFVDVDPDTLNVDPERLAAAITPDTAAVCAVNVLGNPCDFRALDEVLADAGRRFGREIVLLEDNCESMGAEYDGRQCGTLGLMGTFSFFFSHHISTMEGGMVCTDDEELFDILVCLRAHGWTRNLRAGSPLAAGAGDPFEEAFRFVLPGYNVRPIEMSGAVGSAQLARFPEFLASRRANAFRWRSRMAPLSDTFRIQRQPDSGSWFGLSVIVEPRSGLSRRRVVAELEAQGIACRPVVAGNFARQPALAWLDHTIAAPLSGADLVHDRGLYVGNSDRPLAEEIDLVTETLASLCGGGALRAAVGG
jgi:CDP-6-deoxy-D-xylo-4-hexulose-3-dehydrase